MRRRPRQICGPVGLWDGGELTAQLQPLQGDFKGTSTKTSSNFNKPLVRPVLKAPAFIPAFNPCLQSQPLAQSQKRFPAEQVSSGKTCRSVVRPREEEREGEQEEGKGEQEDGRRAGRRGSQKCWRGAKAPNSGVNPNLIWFEIAASGGSDTPDPPFCARAGKSPGKLRTRLF